MFFSTFNLKSKNILLISLSELMLGLVFFIPILALYLEKQLFSVTNVAIIFAVQAVTTVLLETPSGAIADLFGRKRVYILGHTLFLVALFFLFIGDDMKIFLLFALLSGASKALTSGADHAIIYDTLLQEKKEKHYKKIISTLLAIWPLGAIIGSVAGGYLASFSLSLPIALSSVPLILAILLAFFIKEPEYHKDNHGNIFKQMFVSLKSIMSNKQILILVLAGLIMMAFGEAAHQLKSIFIDFKSIPIQYFGIVFGFTFAMSSVGHYSSHFVSERIGNKITLILSAIAFPLFLLLATISNGITSMVFLVLTGIPFGLRNPVINHMLNIEVQSSKRATILSINNFSEKLGIAMGGLLLGYLADLYTISTAFKIAAVLMASAALFLFFLKEKN